ncbi:MAG: helix-turn-helix domain-containing protein [Candidatus Marinimicrobia bacterium]|nr:helix-turn-helix domain-containing protein [Candidatus Neomarinimicrobiota bacterium]
MKDFLTIKKVGELLGVHSVTINRYCKQGKLTYYQVGNRKRFLKEDVDKFIEGAVRNATKESADPFNAD